MSFDIAITGRIRAEHGEELFKSLKLLVSLLSLIIQNDNHASH
jgi:hypothetical protein